MTDFSELTSLLPHLPEKKRAACIARIAWLEKSRPKQIIPSGDWRICLLLAGRGFGKTRSAAEDAWWFAAMNDGARIAYVAPTSKDIRETAIEGPSGLLACMPPECLVSYNRSFGEIKLWNGSQINGYSAEEPERLRGPNFSRAVVEELGSWTRPDSWDQLHFALRIGKNPQCVIATTPKPTKVLRELVREAKAGNPSIRIVSGSTYENAENLGPGYIEHMQRRYEGTRLGRQEIQAELLEDMPGALWNRTLLDELRVEKAPEIKRVVVAIDPAVSNNEGSDETGIIVAGRGTDDHLYILADHSGRMTPDEWASKAVSLYRSYNADRIVAEANQGGDLIEAALRTKDRNIPYRAVHATKGKFVRAEPVAALFEQRRGHCVGCFPILEDQMSLFTVDFDRAKSKYSPDRVDALVWAGHDLMLNDAPQWVTDRPSLPRNISIFRR